MNQSYGFNTPPVGREEEDDLVDEARWTAVAVSADAAATKRVEVRILIVSKKTETIGKRRVGKLMSRWRCLMRWGLK